MENTKLQAMEDALQYLRADHPARKTYTVLSSTLRVFGAGKAIVRRINGGKYVAGLVDAVTILPDIDGGPKEATITIRSAANAAEEDALYAALHAAVKQTHPAGSAYDPAVKDKWDIWRALCGRLDNF